MTITITITITTTIPLHYIHTYTQCLFTQAQAHINAGTLTAKMSCCREDVNQGDCKMGQMLLAWTGGRVGNVHETHIDKRD